MSESWKKRTEKLERTNLSKNTKYVCWAGIWKQDSPFKKKTCVTAELSGFLMAVEKIFISV